MAGRDLVSIATVMAILGGTAGYLLSDHYSNATDTALSASAAESNVMTSPVGSVTETASIPDIEPRRETVILEKGSNLMATLTATGLERTVAYNAIEALRDVYNPRKLRAGQEFDLVYSAPMEDSIELLDELSFQPDPETIVSVSRTDSGFEASSDKIELTTKKNVASGTIEQSLFLAAERNGVPIPVLMSLIELYSYEVDFQRDIQPGDSFEVMYQELENDKGERVRYGDLLYASMTLSGHEVRLYSYTDSNGETDFYNQKGESYRRALMRTPINGARLSSGFGKRKHPILGYTKMHKGIDFAAPRGTPIFAAGNGTIAKIGRNGGYGNYIRIRHNDSYETAYAHMKGFAKGLKQGSRVKQGDVIGYVGTTGASTGPHLHYEILKNNAQVNPIRVKMPSGKKLKGDELKTFLADADILRKQYAELSLDNRKIASAQ
ncbi:MULTISPECIES: M23 family metallopeptidase [unclassified Thalassospira]|jgi:murein DD-endopeptidase MepM/ murein hydrolase activator NlpD|nr:MULTISPECIES: M23 family metallopeptidase [unclassified Thalassospira]MEE3047065.1 M23 family metallopeptidase [Pseudomonadota bacterium]URK17853.1 M23 family metallopeptidase [Thalassospira sp. GO-4]|tara:strand:+ start:390 stop:1700 length:1311 start_codon:yes stop_codon:yes gene_type:complete